ATQCLQPAQGPAAGHGHRPQLRREAPEARSNNRDRLLATGVPDGRPRGDPVDRGRHRSSRLYLDDRLGLARWWHVAFQPRGGRALRGPGIPQRAGASLLHRGGGHPPMSGASTISVPGGRADVRLTPWDERALGMRTAEIIGLQAASSAAGMAVLAEAEQWSVGHGVRYLFGRFDASSPAAKGAVLASGHAIVECSLTLARRGLDGLPQAPARM